MGSEMCIRDSMNGCVCVLEDIIFHDREILPNRCEVGDVIPLQYMPVALLLRAQDVKWQLPTEQLPPLPSHVNRQGLFLLRPHTAYFKHDKIHVKRVQFPVFDASVRIVYSAQGEEFEATVADLAKPHEMLPDVFWLASYVMISRARSLEGLLFTRMCSREALEKGAPPYLLEEIDRLIALEKISRSRLQKYLVKACKILPKEIIDLFLAGETMPHNAEQQHIFQKTDQKKKTTQNLSPALQTFIDDKKTSLKGETTGVPAELQVTATPVSSSRMNGVNLGHADTILENDREQNSCPENHLDNRRIIFGYLDPKPLLSQTGLIIEAKNDLW